MKPSHPSAQFAFVLALSLTLLAPLPSSADPCCVAQLCADLTPAECASQLGILGFCRIGDACGGVACGFSRIRPIRDLHVVKSVPDLSLTWSADPNATGYHARSVTDKGDVSSCDTIGAPIPGSAPSTVAEAIDVDALSSSLDPLRFYCVNGGCPGSPGACCALGLCEAGKTAADCLGTYLGDGSTCPNSGCQSVADVTPCLVGGNVLFLDGDPGSHIHPGIDTIVEGVFLGAAGNGDLVEAYVEPTDPSQGSWWMIDLTSRRVPVPLTVGVYEIAERYPLEPVGTPGMHVRGDGRACNTLHGRFQIHEIDMMGTTLLRLTAAWEQTCDERPGAVLRGCLHFEP